MTPRRRPPRIVDLAPRVTRIGLVHHRVTRQRTDGPEVIDVGECARCRQEWPCTTRGVVDEDVDARTKLMVIRNLHRPVGFISRKCVECHEPWPCRTRSLAGAP